MAQSRENQNLNSPTFSDSPRLAKPQNGESKHGNFETTLTSTFYSISMLDDQTRIKQLDTSNVYGSIEELGLQCQQTWNELQTLEINENYSQIKRVVLAGMGGSALGAEIIKAVYWDQLNVSFEIVRDYHLPQYIDKETLVILSSYSGTTEEVIQAAQEVEATHAKVMVISSGGDLERLANEKNYPFFKINPQHNPSGQPRMALGYGIIGLLGLLQKANILPLQESEVQEIIDFLAREKEKYGMGIPEASNPAKQVASQIVGRFPCVITGEHLTGNAKTLCNQINENAKNISAFYHIPELNHHLMEGLRFPQTNKEGLQFVLFRSELYSPRITKRFTVTKDVIEKNEVPVTEFWLTGRKKLLEAFEMLMVGSYINFYVAMANDLDPAPIPWVDYFKDQLKK